MLYVADAVDKVDYNLLTTLSTILYPMNIAYLFVIN